MIVTLTGPSGSGKSTIARTLCDRYPTWKEVVSVTTREPREGEVPGIDYNFLTEEEYDRIKPDLVEKAEYRGHRYGIHRVDPDDGFTHVAVVNRHGRDQFRDAYEGQCVSALVLPPNLRALWTRLKNRGDPPSVRRSRLADVEQETLMDDQFERVIVNSSVDTAVEEIWWLAFQNARA